MIEQGNELWPPDGDRPRKWSAQCLGPAGVPDTVVILRYCAILAPDEDLTEYPKTLELTWAEWEAMHADYGLSIDGTPLEGVPL